MVTFNFLTQIKYKAFEYRYVTKYNYILAYQYLTFLF